MQLALSTAWLASGHGGTADSMSPDRQLHNVAGGSSCRRLQVGWSWVKLGRLAVGVDNTDRGRNLDMSGSFLRLPCNSAPTAL